MDLNRSQDFFEPRYMPEVRNLLINIAVDYPEVTYYQGMNYLSIFLFYVFEKDANKAYQFLSYLVELCIGEYFGQSFQGIMKLIFVVDKLLQQVYPSIWSKLKRGHVTSIHFSVPNLITLFTSMIKSKDAYPHICDIMDCVLSQGIPALVKALLMMLEVQQSHLFKIPAEQLLLVMKNVEKDPLAIVKHGGVKDTNAYLDGLSKRHIADMNVTLRNIYSLEDQYEQVHRKLVETWEKV